MPFTRPRNRELLCNQVNLCAKALPVFLQEHIRPFAWNVEIDESGVLTLTPGKGRDDQTHMLAGATFLQEHSATRARCRGLRALFISRKGIYESTNRS